MKIETLLDYDLYLTMSWGPVSTHGVCGHTFELLEYFMILNKHFNVGIFLCEYDSNIIEQCLNKYNLTYDEIQHILSRIVFNKGSTPTLIRSTNILVVDGGSNLLDNVTFLVNNLLAFSCQQPYDKRFMYLQDERLYDSNDITSIDYKKKIYFDKFKPIDKSYNNTLLYGTSNCRPISTSYLKNLDTDKNYILVTNSYYDTPSNVEIYRPPVNNLFELFDTYIYTSVPRVWDCSPRFLAECKYYNKKIIFDTQYDIKQDLGLYYRVYDIKNDFDSLYLKQDDQIIQILKGIL